MNRVKVAFGIAVCLLSGLSVNAQVRRVVSSSISGVTVFLNQAQVVRQGRISLDPGSYQLVLDKISPDIEPNSIEATLPPGVSILSVTTENDYLVKNQIPESVVILKDSLRNTDELLFSVNADLESLKIQKDLLLANRQLGGSQGVKADELEDVLGIFQRKLQEMKNEALKLNRYKMQLEEISGKLQLQLDEFESGNLQLNNKILLNVIVDAPVREGLAEVTYLVNNVSWYPVYDIRVKDTKSPINFILKAKVSQTSGEDWNHVKLKLTTTNPVDRGNLPELNVNRLAFLKPEPKYNAYSPLGKVDYDANATDSVSAIGWVAFAPDGTLKFNAPVYSFSITQAFGVAEFDVKVPYTIPSNGSEIMVELQSFSLPASYGNASIPLVEEKIYVVAKVPSNELLNQLSGEASVYFAGTYMGKTTLSPNLADTLLISLGKDKRMTVKREKVKEKSSKSFLGSTRSESNTIEISVNNPSSEEAIVDIDDQIPVSSDASIAVELKDNGGASVNSESGKLSWKLKVPARQTVKVRFTFEVKYPAGKQITAY